LVRVFSSSDFVHFLYFGPIGHSVFGGIDMKGVLARLWKDEEGQDLTEYALLLVLLTLAAVTTLNALATAINGVFANAAANLST
jgi:Flp pilus assembly pilin Flp